MSAKLSALLEILSLGSKDSLAAHVNAEPRILSDLFAKLSADASLSGKDDDAKIVAALNSFKMLAEQCMVSAETFLINALPVMLANAGHKQKNVRSAAEDAVKILCSGVAINS